MELSVIDKTLVGFTGDKPDVLAVVVPEGVEAANGSGHHSILPAQQDKQQQAAQIDHLRSELERTVAAVNTERELREVRGLMQPCQL